MPKSTEKMKAVKDRIFQAAMELFEEYGYENTSILEITRKAGVSKGTFFTHFPSKDGVFAAVGQILNEYIEQTVAQGVEKKWYTREILSRCIHVAARWCEENRSNLYQVLISSMHKTSIGTKTTDNRRKLTSLMTEVLQRGQELGEIKNGMDPGQGAAIIISIYFALMFDWINDDYSWSLKNKLESCMGILLEGMAS